MLMHEEIFQVQSTRAQHPSLGLRMDNNLRCPALRSASKDSVDKMISLMIRFIHVATQVFLLLLVSLKFTLQCNLQWNFRLLAGSLVQRSAISLNLSSPRSASSQACTGWSPEAAWFWVTQWHEGYLLFAFVKLFYLIYFKRNETEKQRYPIQWFTSKMLAIARAESG